MGFLSIIGSVAEIGTGVYDSIRGGSSGAGTDLGFGITCEGDYCVPPEQIKAAILAANYDERSRLRHECGWKGWIGDEYPSHISGETPDHSCARLSFHSGGGRGGRFSDAEKCELAWINEMLTKYNISGGSMTTAPQQESSGPSTTEQIRQEAESLFSDWVDTATEPLRAGVEAGIQETRERQAQASAASQMSDTQMLLLVAGIAGVGFFIARRG